MPAPLLPDPSRPRRGNGLRPLPISEPRRAAPERAFFRWLRRDPLYGRPRSFLVTRLRWIIAVLLAVLTGAALISWSRTPVYHAGADVLVQPHLLSPGTAPQPPDMGSEKALAGSQVVLDIAAQRLGTPENELAGGVSVSVPLNTRVLHISYTGADPKAAARRAQAVAEAYVAYWGDQQPVITDASGPVKVVPSAVISPATAPTSPASPKHMVDVGIAAIIGLLLGVGTAWLRDRYDDRLRGAADFTRACGQPILALVPRRRHQLRPGSGGDIGASASAAYGDVATLLARAADTRGARTVLVASASGEAQVSVASHVAASLARRGRRVLLLHAHLRRSDRTYPFGVDTAPGLAEVLEGRVQLGEAVQETPVPGLQVMVEGYPATDISALLHSPALRQLPRRLRADLVVIDGPPLLAGTDIATLAECADLALLVAVEGRTGRASLRAANRQLDAAQLPVLGGVLENASGRARPTPTTVGGLPLGPQRDDRAVPDKVNGRYPEPASQRG